MPNRAGRRDRGPCVAALVAALAMLSLPARSADRSATAAAPPAGAPPAGSAARAAPAQTSAVHPVPAQEALQVVVQAREFEDRGAYARALAEWRRLRLLAPPDGDLELVTALDEARSGQIDAAAARLSSGLLSAAALDTLPVTRYRTYTVERQGVYVNGTFDGWHWYVWRARAEVAAARGLWEEAVAAARRCVAARPMSGKEWLLLAVCAGRTGREEEARAAAREAVTLDGTLAETHYLDALWAWRDGRRAEAQAGFRASLAIDSTFRPAAVALVRARLPGTAPDTLPSVFLTGPRAVGMLTSPVGPKLEEYVEMEQAPVLAGKIEPAVPDSLKGRVLPLWLFVDAQGRVLLDDLPWYPPGTLPTSVVAELTRSLPQWRFRPAIVHGEPHGVWMILQYTFPR